MPRVHSIRQVEIVKALANHRHFGLAAKALGVSQPALTRSLKQIEADLGVALFDRQGVTPTPFGEIVLRHGERAAAEFHELMREITLAKGLEIGELRIALGPYPADISGERAVGVLLQRHPKVFVEMRSANWERAVGHVLDGAVDLGFAEAGEAGQNPDLQIEPIRNSPLFFFCAAGHPLAGKERLALEDILDYPWVGPTLPGRMSAGLPATDKPFAVVDRMQGRVNPRALVGSFSAIKHIVLAGHALGAAISSQISRELSEGLCVRLPIATPWLNLNYGFITKRGRSLSPAAKAFMDIAREIEGGIPQ